MSLTQKCLDPIGFTCPLTLVPKILLQELWKIKINWDDEVREEYKDCFLKWREEMNYLTNIKISPWNLVSHKKKEYNYAYFL